MSAKHGLKQQRPTTFLGRLRTDVRGNTLMIVAFAMMPLIAMVGSGLDMARAYVARDRLQQACDAGSLAARRLLSGTTLTPAVETEATNYFNFNFPQASFGTAAFTPVVTVPSIGTVKITVTNGSLIDGNKTQEVDERARADLVAGVWKDLQLTVETGANAKISETVLAYKNAKEQDYRTYWSYRGQQADKGAVYDATFQVHLTTEQTAYYRDVLGYTTDQLTTLENKVTAEYRELNTRFGSAGNSYNANYSFDITSGVGLAEVNQLKAGIKVWTAEELLNTISAGLLKAAANTQINVEAPNIVGHDVTITTSQGVGTNAGPLVIDLVNRPKPLVLTDAEKLAFAAADRIDVTYLAGNPVSNVTVNFVDGGTANDSIVRTGSSWTAAGLKVGMHIQISGATNNVTDKGVSLQIKAITDTTVNGVLTSTITLTSGATLYSENGRVVTITPVALNPNRSDVVNAGINFTNVNGTGLITRTDGGDWLADGFTAGELFQVTGNTRNATGKTVYYTIASVTETTITLTAGTTLSDENGVEAVFTPKVDNLALVRPAITAIVIEQRDDVNVDATGRVKVTAGTTVYLGSGQSQAAMKIDQVTAPGEVRIKSKFGLVNDSAAAGVANVIGGDLIVEAGQGAIGTAARAFVVDLTDTSAVHATLTARAFNDLFITELNGNVYLEGASSVTGRVVLQARAGSILDALASDTAKLSGNRIELTASGSIGTASNALETDLTSLGSIKATATGNIYLYETLGDLNIDVITSSAGDVELGAKGSIVNATGDGMGTALPLRINVIGRSVALTAENGAIGRSGSDLQIDSGFSGTGGALTTASMQDTFIVEALGDLLVNQIGTGINAVSGTTYTAFIAAAGSILNARTDGASNVTSGRVKLFATNNIGSATRQLNTAVGTLQGTSTLGSTWIANTGAMSIDALDGSSTPALVAGGSITISTASPMTICEDVNAGGDVLMVAHDKFGSADNLVIQAGKTVESKTGSVRILAGDDLTIEAGARVIAKTFVALEGDYQGSEKGVAAPSGQANVDAAGSVITIAGSITAGTTLTISGESQNDTVRVTGSLEAQTITLHGNAGDDTVFIWGSVKAQQFDLYGDAGNDVIALNPDALRAGMAAGPDLQLQANTAIFGGDGEDSLSVSHLATMTTSHGGVRDQIRLDGGAGTDQYAIDVRGSSDYIVSINDSGAPADGADQLTINGTVNDDVFLLRKNFVALMNASGTGTGYTAQVERINYNETLNGRLLVNGLDGKDSFYVDDNATLTTIDGGAGADYFQFGQMFGSARDPNFVAPGDEIETTETTLGYLSRGISFATTVFGGDGNDRFTVYSNKAPLKLFGEDGNDEFVVRAFVLAGSGLSVADMQLSGGAGDDHIEYNINAPVSIDGGAGVDTVVVVGTEAADNFVITDRGVQGAGLNVDLSGVEKVEVDGMEGDDHFFVLSTAAGMVTTIIGGLGNDTVDVGGDVTKAIVSADVEGTSGFINHSVTSADAAYNGIYAEGIKLNVVTGAVGAIGIRQQTEGDLVVVEDGGPASVTTYDVGMNVAAPADLSLVYMTVSATQASSQDAANGGKSILVSIDGVNYVQSLVLTFDPGATSGANAWARTQKIYVRAVSDNAAEGERTAMISHSVLSANAAFNHLAVANVQVRVIDNDLAGLIIRQTDSATQVVEGDTAGDSYSLALTRQPAVGEIVTVHLGFDPAQLAIASMDPALASRLDVNARTVTFDSTNWNQAFVVKLTAVDDSAPENRATETLKHTVTSTGGGNAAVYTAVTAQDLTVDVRDNDAGGVVITQSQGSTVVSATSDEFYTVSLTKAPTADVVVKLLPDGKTLLTSYDNDARFSVDAKGIATVTFSAANWNVPFKVKVSLNPNAATAVGNTPVQTYPQQDHVLASVKGSLFIEGSVVDGRDRSLKLAVMLPTERDTALPIVNLQNAESTNTDTLNIYNDGSITHDRGTLGKATEASGLAALFGGDAADVKLADYGNISGLNMGGNMSLDFGTVGAPDVRRFDGGITYHNVEVIDLLLGRGNDTFTVAHTVAGSITVVQGGGGDDTLIVTGGGGVNAPLVLFGDTSQDGKFYNSTVNSITGNGFVFSNFGNDLIDASGAGGGVTIYGGQGNDTLIGSQFADQIAGGSGNDTLFGNGGNDHLYGDSGFNIDLSKRFDLASPDMLTVVNAGSVGNYAATRDNLAVGNDTIDGGAGDDIVIGDHGVITQIAGTRRLTDNGNVVQVASFNDSTGGNDVVRDLLGNNLVIGGIGADTIDVAGTSSIVIGDNGKVVYSADATRLVSIETVDYDALLGGNDTITALANSNLVFGGVGADTITTGEGDDTVFGDNGRIDFSATGVLSLLRTTDTKEASGGDDTITTGRGTKRVFGGVGGDTLTVGQGVSTHAIVVGDNGHIQLDATGSFALDIASDDYLANLGGNDTVTTGDGNHVVIGGFGADTITTGNGVDTILGDNGVLTFNAAGVLVKADSSVDTNVSGGNDTISSLTGNKLVIGGVGDDGISVTTGSATILGDSGIVTYDAAGAVLQRVESTGYLANLGGNDTVTTGDGNHFVIGGFGADTITTGNGVDTILGDNGVLTFNAAGALVLADSSSDTNASGGNDTIQSASGNKLVIGGVGNDSISVTTGTATILGDNGTVTFDAAGAVLQRVESTGYLANLGGNDTVTTGDGNHLVIGGFGADFITTGVGRDTVLGDNGVLTFNAAGALVLVDSSSDTNVSGGADTIQSASGNKLVIGGVGDDRITVTTGTATILGDNGTVTFDAAGAVLQRVESTGYLANLGGNDTVTTGDGNHVVIGGFGADTITTGNGVDTILGDNGVLTFNAAGALVLADSSSDTNTSGGNDVISSLTGTKLVIGGVGDDHISVATGTGTILGDSGIVTYDAAGAVLQRVESTGYLASLGGNDSITTGDGNHVILGGYGSDTLTTGTGTDTLFGDNGIVTFNASGVVVALDATSDTEASGGADTITSRDGNKTVVGGVGSDHITVGNGNATLLGDNGLITFDATGTLLQRIDSTGYFGNLGGNDTITAGDGNHVVIGGFGNDAITTGNGLDHLLGDNGSIVLNAAGRVISMDGSVDSNVSGGNDVITAADGEKFIVAGVGADKVTVGKGNGAILGDNGIVTFDAAGAVLQRIESTGYLPGLGGNDTITAGDGNHVVVGGYGSDVIATGTGNDTLFGDNGVVTFNAQGVVVALDATSDTEASGGADTITSRDGNKTVVGGVGSDRITVGNGNAVVLGDNGLVNFDAAGALLQTISSTGYLNGLGGDDTITAGNGQHVVIGGFGNDTVTTGNGLDYLLGDNGSIVLNAAGRVTSMDGTVDTNASGGNDVITAADGDKFVIGGVGRDIIRVGNGNGILIGDNGLALFDAAGNVAQRIESTGYLVGLGGDDSITAGDGNHVVLGGVGNDTVTTGNGRDILLGDNGRVLLNAAGSAVLIESFDDVAVSGGNDSITSLDGLKYVLGGYANDLIQLGNGNNVVFGDNGRIVIDDGGTVRDMLSTNPGVGGNDRVVTGNGRNVVIGGFGDDTLKAGDGGNVMLGDNGEVTREANGNYIEVITTSPKIGGNDLIKGGNGEDILLGGNGKDELFGYNGFNVVIGDNGQVLYKEGRVVLAQTIDLYDGDDDILHGGDDLSVLFGGFGSDLLYGSFTTDVMAGDYAAISFIGDKATSVVRFGPATNSPDLIARAQDVLFTPPYEMDRKPDAATDNRALLARMDLLVASISAPQLLADSLDEFSLRGTETFSHTASDEADTALAAAATPVAPAATPAPVNGEAKPVDATPATPAPSAATEAVPAAGASGVGTVAAVDHDVEADLSIAMGDDKLTALAGLAGLTGAALSHKARTMSQGGAMQFDPRTGQWLAAGTPDAKRRQRGAAGLGLMGHNQEVAHTQTTVSTPRKKSLRQSIERLETAAVVAEVVQAHRDDRAVPAAPRARSVQWSLVTRGETETTV